MQRALPRAAGRSQKINNQLKGLKEVKEDTEVLVFIDSDARLGPEFLKNLIVPLKEPGIGIATGFRWYLPMKGGFFHFYSVLCYLERGDWCL